MAKKRVSSSTRRTKRPAKKAATHRSRAVAAPSRSSAGEGDGAARTDAGRALWSGTISFGLVTIPVNLFPARRAKRTAMRMLADDGTPLHRRWCCPKDQRLLDDDEIVRGYEVAEDRFVVVTDEELEALAPRKSRDIDLRRFVPRAEIDPRYFEHGYFLTPATDSTKAYRLLAEVMEDTGRAGVATFVMREKEYLVAILAERGVLSAETLRFADELRSPEAVGLPDAKKKPGRARVTRVERAIDALAKRGLEKSELEDDDDDRLLALAERKRKRGEDVVEAPEGAAGEDGEQAEIIDLMEVLKRSLGARGAAHGTGASSSRRPARRARSSR